MRYVAGSIPVAKLFTISMFLARTVEMMREDVLRRTQCARREYMQGYLGIDVPQSPFGRKGVCGR